MIERDFSIAPILKDKKPVLLIRTHIQNKEEIDRIIAEILEHGKIEIKGIVKFRDSFTAKLRLRDLGLLSESTKPRRS